ncbi:MAG: flagellar biosynthesis protein FlhB [Velocimicrobium sp.]
MQKFKYNLQFFAKEGPGGEKTEEATSKKLDHAREEGQVARSQDLVMSLQLIGLFLTLKIFISSIGSALLEVFSDIYGLMSTLLSDEFNTNMAHALLTLCIEKFFIITLPLFLIAFLIAFIGNLVQVKWKPTLKTLAPKLNKFNPISGVKKLFSKDKIIDLIKQIAKLLVIIYVVYNALKDQWGMLSNLYSISLNNAISLIGGIVINLGLKISIFFLTIALFDFWYQKHKFSKDMRMSKQEVKDEYKQSEGDPHIKGKIRQKMREASQRRMMQDVPEADVVITNPTHLAVAIKYDRGNTEAPVLVAKGADYIAQKIKEIANNSGIEIVENKPLARMLYYNVEIGNEIPPELYQMVAEVLAYVYGIKGKL